MIGLKGFRIALEKAYAAGKHNGSAAGTPSNAGSQPINLKSMNDKKVKDAQSGGANTNP